MYKIEFLSSIYEIFIVLYKGEKTFSHSLRVVIMQDV